MGSPTRERIRAAAISLFADKGFSAAATSEICRRARVTKPVLYYYFKSKEKLYLALVEECRTETLERLRRAAASAKSIEEKLVNILAEDFAYARRNPKTAAMFMRLIFAPQKEVPVTHVIRAGRDRLCAIEDIVREAVKRGELKCRPRDFAEILLGATMIYTTSYLVQGKPALNRNLARRIVRFLLDGSANKICNRQV